MTEDVRGFYQSREACSSPQNRLRRPRGEKMYSSTLSLTSVIDGVDGQSHAPAALPIVQQDGWVPGSIWTGAENRAPPPRFDPRTFQPVACRYTDWVYLGPPRVAQARILFSGKLTLIQAFDRTSCYTVYFHSLLQHIGPAFKSKAVLVPNTSRLELYVVSERG